MKHSRVWAGAVLVIALVGLTLAAPRLRQALGDMPDEQKDMRIDAAVRQEVVSQAIERLEHDYVMPEKVAGIRARLQKAEQQADLNRIESAQALADHLTELLQAETDDRHLVVRYFEQAVPDETDDDSESPQEAAEALNQKRLNYGWHNVDRLQFNIGYIDLHAFGRPAVSHPRIAAAMRLLADTEALIIDLRRCGGGDPDTVMALASYLFERPTHLNDIYFRDEDRLESRWTSAEVDGLRYGETRPLYLLTSADTFSGCEDFAYALKNASRATLIGETTGGGAHAGSPHRLSAHFMMFVPSGRPISPVTHTDWEGVGVEPNIASAASSALDLAQIEILQHLLIAETDERRRAQIVERIDELD